MERIPVRELWSCGVCDPRSRRAIILFKDGVIGKPIYANGSPLLMADHINLITDHYVIDRLLLFRNNGEPAGGCSSAEVALLEENERLRRDNELPRAPGGAAINSGGSAPSSSSLTIAEEPSAPPERKERESSGSLTRLFGVTLSAKRREYPIEPGFNYSTKPQLPLNQRNLSLNQISSSSPSSM
ncbi:hypothetical protein KSP40_PGU011302 [Platanthera guangdongensis]|uniref:Uncharacterized protein n=1 Tax=Platanthera guangdongensis TaxID=2320717 RepID=A0ABR2MI08_9ASPA